MTRTTRHLTRVAGYATLAAAVLITSWKFGLDWKVAAVVSLAFTLPGVASAVKLIREWRARDGDPGHP